MDLLYGIRILAEVPFVLRTNRAFDSDRRTDGPLVANTALHSMHSA